MASSRMLALLGLLAVAGYQNRDRLSEMFNKAKQGNGDSAAGQSSGTLGSMLGGLFGAGSPGDLRGGLGDLLDSFNGAGRGETAKSWVDTGANRKLSSRDLEETLGEETLSALSQQTGLSRTELLARLETVLPEAVDKLTPEGRLPTESELTTWQGR